MLPPAAPELAVLTAAVAARVAQADRRVVRPAPRVLREPARLAVTVDRARPHAGRTKNAAHTQGVATRLAASRAAILVSKAVCLNRDRSAERSISYFACKYAQPFSLANEYAV
jgi:hypothetical protein